MISDPLTSGPLSHAIWGDSLFPEVVKALIVLINFSNPALDSNQLSVKEYVLKLLVEMVTQEPQVFTEQVMSIQSGLVLASVNVLGVASDNVFPQLHASANQLLTCLTNSTPPALYLTTLTALLDQQPGFELSLSPPSGLAEGHVLSPAVTKSCVRVLGLVLPRLTPSQLQTNIGGVVPLLGKHLNNKDACIRMAVIQGE